MRTAVEGYAFKLGAAKVGVVVAPLNPNLAPDVVRHLVDRVDPSYLVVDAELWPKVASGVRGTGREPDVTIEIGGSVRRRESVVHRLRRRTADG